MATFVLLVATFITAFIGGVVVEATRRTMSGNWVDARNQARIRQLHSQLRAHQPEEEG